MAVNKTKKQAISYMGKLKGHGWDFDFAFGWQCYDLVNQYYNHLTGNRLYGLYAKNIHIDNKKELEKHGKIIKNYDKFLPQKGDIFIMHGGYGQGAGHTGIVWSANLNTFVGLEQNWYGGGSNKTEVAQLVTHSYDNPLYFFRPDYKKSKATKAKEKVKEVVSKVTPTKKKKILLVAGHGGIGNDPGASGNSENERDFIRKNITPQIKKLLEKDGHKVELYGGSKQDQNLYQDTAHGQKIGNKKDYGLYWAKGQKYDAIIEFHLDAAGSSAHGGHVIKNAYAADEIDKGLQKALKNTVGVIRGITTRRDLLNCNVAYDLNVNYRLIELGFITSKKDMDYIKKNLNKFNAELASAISGNVIESTQAKPKEKAKAKQTTWNWKGRFTANTTIKVRKSPGLKGRVVESGSWIYKNQWVDIVQIKKQDGYWWGKFKYPTNPRSGYFWLALTPITDKKERILKERKMYGKIKWK